MLQHKPAPQPARLSMLHINLNWNPYKRNLFGLATPTSTDLNLGCMYQLHSGQLGVVQAFGNALGQQHQAPYIYSICLKY